LKIKIHVGIFTVKIKSPHKIKQEKDQHGSI